MPVMVSVCQSVRSFCGLSSAAPSRSSTQSDRARLFSYNAPLYGFDGVIQMVMIPLAAALSLALAWTRMNAPACCVFAICARSALDMETSFSVRVMMTV